MGVEIVLNARVNGVEDAAEGGKRLTLSNGTVLTADLYLPLYGVRPNSEFVPAHLLDDNGNIKMQPTLRVRGLNNVWAAGDVSDVENKQAIKAGAQSKHVYSNLEAVLTGNEAGVTAYKPSAMPMIFVTMGKKKGTGQLGGFKPFSMMVSYIKGRTLFVEKAPAVAAGKIL
jgi:NADH dehydrogenase FAD-containing subunit